MDGRINKLTASEFFYEWMFRNQNYQLFGPSVAQESIDKYKSWDETAIRSDSLGFRFNNEKVKLIETALKEVAGKDLAAIRSGFVDFETEYPKAIEKLKAAGIDDYVAEIQRQLDEFWRGNNRIVNRYPEPSSLRSTGVCGCRNATEPIRERQGLI